MSRNAFKDEESTLMVILKSNFSYSVAAVNEGDYFLSSASGNTRREFPSETITNMLLTMKVFSHFKMTESHH